MRALAVLAVLAFHENLPWIRGGFLGVDVFFVLSGYLITDLLVTRYARDGRAALGQFWIRRARRLLPALAVMLVTVTAAVAVLEPDQLTALRRALLGAASYTSNWTQALQHQSYFAIFGPPPPLEHLWSLAVEEQFYLVWPLIVAIMLATVRSRRWRPLVPAAGALASAILMLVSYGPGRDPSRVYFGTDTHASGLMIGAALALSLPLARVTGAAGALRRRLDLLGLAGLAVLGWACWHLAGADPLVYPAGLVLASLAAGAVVLAAAAPGIVGTALSWRPLRWLGVRSYGIYLWHWPVIAITGTVAVRAAASIPARVIDAALPVAIAAASWRWLEKPVLSDGLLTVLRSRWRRLRHALPAARRSPAGALPLVLPVAMLTVACTAGYGILLPGSGPTLQQQIAAGTKISAQTQSRHRPDSPPVPVPPIRDQLPILARRPHAAAPVPRPGPHRPAVVPGWKVTAIGDSVMLSAARELQASLPGIYIDAKVSRQMSDGVALVRRLKAAGRLRDVVIVALGTNGTVTPGEVSQLHAAVGSRWLLLVTTFVPRPWQHEVNATLFDAAKRYPDVVLVNWKAAIEHRTSLLWSDGVHPQPAGGALYARIVRVAVLAALARHQPKTQLKARRAVHPRRAVHRRKP